MFRGPHPSPAPGVGQNLDARISLSIRARGLRFGVQVDLDPNSFSNQVYSQCPWDRVKFVFIFNLDLNSVTVGAIKVKLGRQVDTGPYCRSVKCRPPAQFPLPVGWG